MDRCHRDEFATASYRVQPQVLSGKTAWQPADPVEEVCRDQDRYVERFRQSLEPRRGVHDFAKIRNLTALEADFSCNDRAAMEGRSELRYLAEARIPSRSI